MSTVSRHPGLTLDNPQSTSAATLVADEGCGHGPKTSCGGLRFPKRGDVVLHSGRAGEEAFLCVRGLLKSRKMDSFGREVITQIIEPGMFFGIEALFGQPYATTVQAIEPSEVCGLCHRQEPDPDRGCDQIGDPSPQTRHGGTSRQHFRSGCRQR